MNKTQTRYAALKKPRWAPPAKVFGPVWTFLYILIAISFGTVFYEGMRGQVGGEVWIPCVLNLIFNFAYTPIQFKLRNNWLALVDVLLVLLTLKWSIWAIYPYVHWAAWLLAPYLLWVCFATVLQLSVTWLNR